MRMPTTSTTPTMCHQAEIMFSPDVIRMLNMLMITAASRNAAYRMYVDMLNDAPNQSSMCAE